MAEEQGKKLQDIFLERKHLRQWIIGIYAEYAQVDISKQEEAKKAVDFGDTVMEFLISNNLLKDEKN